MSAVPDPDTLRDHIVLSSFGFLPAKILLLFLLQYRHAERDVTF